MTDLHVVDDENAAAAGELPDGEYAIVELLGHRTVIGRVQEIERFGSKLLQIEPLFDGKLLEPVLHHGNAIYAYTPCSKAVAAKRCPRQEWALPAAVRARLAPALPAPDAGFVSEGEARAGDGEFDDDDFDVVP